MSDFRFGSNDYRLNIDWEHQAPDFCFGWDCVDWNRVEWVEIDSVRYLKELTCHETNESPWTRHFICSSCGEATRKYADQIFPRCPACGARNTDYGNVDKPAGLKAVD